MRVVKKMLSVMAKQQSQPRAPKAKTESSPIRKCCADAPISAGRPSRLDVLERGKDVLERGKKGPTKSGDINPDLARGHGTIKKIAADAPLSTRSGGVKPDLVRGNGTIKKIAADAPISSVRVNPDLVAGKGARIKVFADDPFPKPKP